uniref:HSF-type DNA-binding domain-containing protein n=1 Tax=Arundo donax TaxID=35708 RepID=A0A0A9F8Q0_ARUDO
MASGGPSMTSGGAGVDAAPGVAPFVAKTYRMVDDPATDAVIAWGADNNSFVVAEPFVFSQTLLPAHFKHSNFSSFVRQLNTYGFRKVDPDRWEFAHVSFLRWQTHLLRHIVRRSSGGGGKRKDDGAGDEDAVAMEVVRLRREQRAIKDRVAVMWRRVQETERRPKQMLAFLVKVAGDPQVLRRLVAAGAESDDGFAAVPDGGGEAVKRARLLLDGDRGSDGAHADGLYGSEAGVDFAGLDNGVGGFGGDVQQADAVAGEGGYPPPPYGFPVDSTGY